MDVLVRSYTEDGYQPIPSAGRLSDGEYGRGLKCFVPACTDIVLIDPRRRTIYLARRVSKPMTGWWWIGGKVNPAETKEEAVVRNFERETSLKLHPKSFKLVAVLDYRWKDRAQVPQDTGCHMLGYTFTADLNSDALVAVSSNLGNQESGIAGGLSEFNRERLVEEKVFPAILDLYDHIFPAPEEVECGPLSLVSSDARRDIRELGFNTSAFQDFCIRDVSKPLGQHFHRRKFEIFYFLEGGGIISTARVNVSGLITGEVKRFEVATGSAIRIPPYHTHRFDLRENTRFVAFSSEPFDAADMISCPIG